jgi:hypothetical protein
MWGIPEKSQHPLKFERCPRPYKFIFSLLSNWTKYVCKLVMRAKREPYYPEAFAQEALSAKLTLQNIA